MAAIIFLSLRMVRATDFVSLDLWEKRAGGVEPPVSFPIGPAINNFITVAYEDSSALFSRPESLDPRASVINTKTPCPGTGPERGQGQTCGDLRPENRTNSSWNFPFMIPHAGEGEFDEETQKRKLRLC
ncbi:hypothetical protein [Ruegeria pomeroyi]|uniref:Uncharacterized protein n=1 Tax=Ruegeria pomeroyi TaxID=89184 RepID=A0A850LGD8_9RHOB|nr:hypothetical protein [Ruegeria pomeroyi]NVK96807.1 hypothetical protein [Ruegeria pomeroyi]NVL00025.1 hypothetical protein [Ruegeria pomeroyi]